MAEVQAALAARQRELHIAEELREETLQRVSELEAAFSELLAQKDGLEVKRSVCLLGRTCFVSILTRHVLRNRQITHLCLIYRCA